MPVDGSYFDSPPIVPPSGPIPEEQKSAIATAKDMMFLDQSSGVFLTRLGQNYGIPRPELAPEDDDMYSLIVQAIAIQPKTILCTLYSLMTAIFGSQDSYTTLMKRPWRIYEVNPNEFIVEIPFDAIGTTPETASYLHPFSGVVLAGATTTAISFKGDATGSYSPDITGLGVSILVAGSWEEKAIATASYDAATDTTSLTFGSAYSAPPDPGAPFFLTVPGDAVGSFRGDYMAPIWHVEGTSTSVGVATLTDSGLSMTTDEWAGYFLRVGGNFYPIVSNDATTFTLSMAGTPPEGFYAVVRTPIDADEEADQADTPPHADRVYLAGQGKADILRQYALRLVRASGVILRVELI